MNDGIKESKSRGRPPLENKTRQVNIRLDDNTINKLESLANAKSKSMTVNQFIKEITINYLNTLN